MKKNKKKDSKIKKISANNIKINRPILNSSSAEIIRKDRDSR